MDIKSRNRACQQLARDFLRRMELAGWVSGDIEFEQSLEDLLWEFEGEEDLETLHAEIRELRDQLEELEADNEDLRDRLVGMA